MEGQEQGPKPPKDSFLDIYAADLNDDILHRKWFLSDIVLCLFFAITGFTNTVMHFIIV